MNRTYLHKNNYEHQWFYIDVENQTLGRISTQIASNLKNKYSIYYTPYQMSKCYIIILNADKIKISGKKESQKLYKRHSGRPGSLKEETFKQLQQRLPKRIIEKSIKGMLPKNALGRRLFTQLKIYCGSNHPHKAQKPIPLPIK